MLWLSLRLTDLLFYYNLRGLKKITFYPNIRECTTTAFSFSHFFLAPPDIRWNSQKKRGTCCELDLSHGKSVGYPAQSGVRAQPSFSSWMNYFPLCTSKIKPTFAYEYLIFYCLLGRFFMFSWARSDGAEKTGYWASAVGSIAQGNRWGLCFFCLEICNTIEICLVCMSGSNNRDMPCLHVWLS